MTTYRSDLVLGVLIGKGHFGEVLLGEDPVHGAVAVKRLTKDPAKSDGEWDARKQGLLREAQLLKQANHRNVVQVHHLDESNYGQSILFAMDLCKGGSLQSAYDAGPIGIARMRGIATDVTQGLQALHARGLLHRDIKPGNLLVGPRNVVKLGDFGLVTDDLVYGYGSQTGYLDHLAPEIHAGQGTSIKTDIWALGMTLYRLLHGRRWYEEASHHPRDVTPAGGYAQGLRWLPHVPPAWRKVIRKMLHDDPSLRYQTAVDVFAALSGLPTEPDWDCKVAAEEVSWTRQSKTRDIHVVWNRVPPRKNEWRAWSEPLGTGRPRTLGSPAGPVTAKAAISDLVSFFEGQS